MFSGFWEKRKLHMQLEILVTTLNSLLRIFLPPCILILLMCAVVCNVLMAKAAGLIQAERYPFILTTLAGWSATLTLIGFVPLRLTGMIRHYSVEVLESMQSQATAELVQNGGGSRGRSKVALGRIFGRRKPLVLNLGHFYTLGKGHCVEYAQSILEQTFNGVMMVDSECKMRLLNFK